MYSLTAHDIAVWPGPVLDHGELMYSLWPSREETVHPPGHLGCIAQGELPQPPSTHTLGGHGTPYLSHVNLGQRKEAPVGRGPCRQHSPHRSGLVLHAQGGPFHSRCCGCHVVLGAKVDTPVGIVLWGGVAAATYQHIRVVIAAEGVL